LYIGWINKGLHNKYVSEEVQYYVEQTELYCGARNAHIMVAFYARFSPIENKNITPPPKKIK